MIDETEIDKLIEDIGKRDWTPEEISLLVQYGREVGLEVLGEKIVAVLGPALGNVETLLGLQDPL